MLCRFNLKLPEKFFLQDLALLNLFPSQYELSPITAGFSLIPFSHPKSYLSSFCHPFFIGESFSEIVRFILCKTFCGNCTVIVTFVYYMNCHFLYFLCISLYIHDKISL